MGGRPFNSDSGVDRWICVAILCVSIEYHFGFIYLPVCIWLRWTFYNRLSGRVNRVEQWHSLNVTQLEKNTAIKYPKMNQTEKQILIQDNAYIVYCQFMGAHTHTKKVRERETHPTTKPSNQSLIFYDWYVLNVERLAERTCANKWANTRINSNQISFNERKV